MSEPCTKKYRPEFDCLEQRTLMASGVLAGLTANLARLEASALAAHVQQHRPAEVRVLDSALSQSSPATGARLEAQARAAKGFDVYYVYIRGHNNFSKIEKYSSQKFQDAKVVANPEAWANARKAQLQKLGYCVEVEKRHVDAPKKHRPPKLSPGPVTPQPWKPWTQHDNPIGDWIQKRFTPPTN